MDGFTPNPNILNGVCLKCSRCTDDCTCPMYDVPAAVVAAAVLDRQAAARHLARIRVTLADEAYPLDDIAYELQALALAMLGEANVDEFSHE